VAIREVTVSQITEQFVSVARAATLLGISQAAVGDLLQANEIESMTLIRADSLRSYMEESA
jgi:predicted transcriptional regulator